MTRTLAALPGAARRLCLSRRNGEICTREDGHRGLHHRTGGRLLWNDLQADPPECAAAGTPAEPAPVLDDGFPGGRALCPVCWAFVSRDGEGLWSHTTRGAATNRAPRPIAVASGSTRTAGDEGRPPVDDLDHLVEGTGVHQIVRHQKGRRLALARQPRQQRHDLGAPGAVEGARRLVPPAAPAARARGRGRSPRVGAGPPTDVRDDGPRRRRARPPPAARRPASARERVARAGRAPKLRHHPHLLAGGEGGKQLGLLEHDPDAIPSQRRAPEALSLVASVPRRSPAPSRDGSGWRRGPTGWTCPIPRDR